MQGYKCYCQPCVPAPQQAARGTMTADAGLSVAVLTIIMVVALVVLAAIGAIAFKLHHEVKMPPVSVYLLDFQQSCVFS